MYNALTAVTFADVEPKFWRVVNSFHRKFPGCDFDETTSAALLAFLKAYDDFRPEFGKSFDNYMTRRVWSDMWTAWTSSVRYNRRFKRGRLHPAVPARGGREEDPWEWLNDDERAVVGIVLDMPREVAKTVKRLGDNPANVRYAVRSYLKGLGWTVRRTRTTFMGIKELL